jgi:vanillate O-demethylase monooxygenase subunit
VFIGNAWYIAAWADEVGSQPLARRVCDLPMVLFRDAAGHAIALEDRCCHRGTPLSIGTVVERGIQCGYHGLVFDRTGKCVEIPGLAEIPERARVRSYAAVEKNQAVWVWPGDPDKADPARIIDYPYHDDGQRWPHRHAVLSIQADYLRLIDNLMDNRHVGYVHRKTIGGNPLAFVKADERLTRRPEGLNLVRWLPNSVPPPTYVRAVGFKGRVDRWADFDFIAPNNVLIWNGAVDVELGAYKTKNRDLPGMSNRSFNSLTPVTRGSCLYFWSIAHNYRTDEPDATEALFNEIAATFLEDKVVVEAQQTRLDERGEEGLVELPSDAARLHAKRLIDRMLAAERRVGAAH